MAVNSNNNMNQENNMNSQCVRALYSYEYSDAGRRVWMEEGETFCLLQGVENEDWWHVYRPDDIHDTFYVPSSYVRKVESGNVNTIDINTDSPGCGVNDAYTTHNKSLNHTNSYDGSTGKLGTFGAAQIQMDPQEGSKDDYINVGLKPYSSSSSHSESKESFTVQYIQAKRPSDLQDINEGDYANLEDLRAAINLPPVSQQASQTPPSPQTPEGDYANLADMNVGEQSPPPLESCEYKKTLLDTWDMYLDPHTNRIFYVHKETKETQWKPPRGQYHQQMKMQRGRSRSSGEYEDVADILPPLIIPINRGKSRSVDYGVPRVPSLKGDMPSGWQHTVNSLGEDVFVDSETKEESGKPRSPEEQEEEGDILPPLIIPYKREKSRSVDYGVPRVPLLKGGLPSGGIPIINVIGEDEHLDSETNKESGRPRSPEDDEEEGDILSPLIIPYKREKSRSVDYGVPRVPLLKGGLPSGLMPMVNVIGEDDHLDSETNKERGGSGNSPTKSPTSELAEKTFPKPESPPTQGLQVQGHTQGLVQGPRHGHQVSDRFQKSRSVMLENLQLGNRYVSNAGPPPPKSATLPPNFSTPAFETQENYGGRKSSQPEIQFTQSVQLNEPIEGMLNRCKLTNGKKGSKKWAFSFAKLTGTNLVFYKDQKSSQPKSGAPHGKSEQMLALRDCSLEKDPKDIGSKKKNMILISSPDGQMILQSEDDAKIQEWFLKLHMKIQELGGNPDAVPADTPNELLTPDTHPALTKKPSFKGRHGRNPSDGGSTLERKGRIKDVLTNFMKNRSEKKELVKKGIYKDAVFGADLKLICEREKTKVPCFVMRAIEAIERRGLDHEGIYRIGGNISSIQKLRCMVDQGEKYDLHDPLWDINILCGTLKLLFRELKEPLFTYSLFDKFLKSFLKEIASERLKAMKATINELPKCHYETVKVLFKHLNKVMDHSLENKMHAHQLAIVFGPTLIWPEVQSQNLATSMVYQSRIVEFVLLEYNNIFR